MRPSKRRDKPAPPQRPDDLTDLIRDTQRIMPQEGPQTRFFETPADICIYGGGAGGGKSWALEAEATRHTNVPGFTAMIFRRTSVQVMAPGGLWDQSVRIYPLVGGRQKRHVLTWEFETDPAEGQEQPGSAVVKFGHLEHEKTVLDHSGAEYCYIAFDELTLFTRYQFFFMLSRNRSLCGVKPYIRATCNPDADSWVREFISWWIDAETGLPIEARRGVLRWMVRIADEIRWGDSREELIERFGAEMRPLSVTFIPASVYDNKIMLRINPEYLASLMALPLVERERLLGGNWKIRPAAGMYFHRTWCQPITWKDVPPGTKWVRGWDLASTPKTQANDPDWSSGTLLGRTPAGRYIIGHNRRDRLGPAGVEKMLKDIAARDTKATVISVPQDPGQAGKFQVQYLSQRLDGYTIRSTPETGDKIERFGPFSAQAQHGNVSYIKDDDTDRWNDPLFSALEGFPDQAHDDDADSLSRAFQMFHDSNDGLLEFYRRQAEEAAKSAGRNPGLDQRPAPPLPWAPQQQQSPGLIELIAPVGTSTVYGMDGTRYTVGTDRKVAVKPADVAPLKRSGFVDPPA